jgi:hypothetical protein
MFEMRQISSFLWRLYRFQGFVTFGLSLRGLILFLSEFRITLFPSVQLKECAADISKNCSCDSHAASHLFSDADLTLMPCRPPRSRSTTVSQWNELTQSIILPR